MEDVGEEGLLSNDLDEQDDHGDKFAPPAPGAYSVGAPANRAAGKQWWWCCCTRGGRHSTMLKGFQPQVCFGTDTESAYRFC